MSVFGDQSLADTSLPRQYDLSQDVHINNLFQNSSTQQIQTQINDLTIDVSNKQGKYNLVQNSSILNIDNQTNNTNFIIPVNTWEKVRQLPGLNNLTIKNPGTDGKESIYIDNDNIRVFNHLAVNDLTNIRTRISHWANRPAIEISPYGNNDSDMIFGVKFNNSLMDDNSINNSKYGFAVFSDGGVHIRAKSNEQIIMQTSGLNINGRFRDINGNEISKIRFNNESILSADDLNNQNFKPSSINAQRSIFLGKTFNTNTFNLFDSIILGAGILANNFDTSHTVSNCIMLTTSKNIFQSINNSVIIDCNGDNDTQHIQQTSSYIIGYSNAFLGNNQKQVVLGSNNQIDNSNNNVYIGNDNKMFSDASLTNNKTIMIGNNNEMIKNSSSGFNDGCIVLGNENRVFNEQPNYEHGICIGSKNKMDYDNTTRTDINSFKGKQLFIGNNLEVRSNQFSQRIVNIGFDNKLSNAFINLKDYYILGCNWNNQYALLPIGDFYSTVLLGNPGEQTKATRIILGTQPQVDGGTPLLINSANEIVKQSSSLRYKKNVKDLAKVDLSGIKVKEYNYLNSDIKRFGMIAEEIHNTEFNNTIVYDKGKPDAINYIEWIPLILKYTQQLEKKHNMLLSKLKSKGIIEEIETYDLTE
jgi:hypothetical protein